MKKLLIAVQFLLLGLFLYNIGIIEIFKHFPHEKGEPANIENDNTFQKFVWEKLKQAQTKGSEYSPECYFSDYAEIMQKKHELPGSLLNMIVINGMMSISSTNVCHGRWSVKDVDIAREKYKKIVDPQWKNREDFEKETAKKGYWSKTGKKIIAFLLPWLLSVYLKNLPLAFVLFLIWWYKEYKTFRVKNPISFAISVLIHPYLIGKLIREKFKEGFYSLCAEVQLRKTKEKFFTLLSRDEISEIRRFAKSNFGRHLLIKRLRRNGLEVRRSFATALLATLLLSFVSVLVSNVQAKTLPKDSDGEKSSITIIHESPPHVLYFENNGPNQGNHFFPSVEGVTTVILEIFSSNCQKLLLKTLFEISSPPKKIEHIPVVG